MSRRCYNCFKEIGSQKICPHCGYEQDTPSDENCLKPGTLITGRYLIGRVRGSDENGIIYNVFDLKTETRRRMREFFPVEHCERTDDGEVKVKPGHEEEFENELKTLKFNSVGDDGEKKFSFLSYNGTGYFIERKQKKPAESANSKKAPVEADDEKILGGKLPAIIIGAAALVAIVILAFVLFKPGKDDKTDDTAQNNPTSQVAFVSPTPAESGSGAWDLPTNTPNTYEYAEPTSSITNSYSEWMAEQGSYDQVITTPTPFTPTPTPYNMWDQLEQDIQKQATPTPTPLPTRRTVNTNSSVQDITSLQWQLIELGWLESSYPSGSYDAATREAVRNFQTYANAAYNAGLSVDGICGPKTFAYLDDYSKAIKPTPTVPAGTPTPAPTHSVIDKNSSPLEIREIQLLLSAQGWYAGDADGVYDYATMEAVIRFQTYVNQMYNSHYLDVTGYVDRNTRLMLDSYWFPAPPEATPEPEATVTTAPTPDPMDETDKLELLDEPLDVKIIASPAAYVYERASVNSSIVASAPNGSVYMMLAKSDSWALLSNNADSNRYVKLSDIEIINSPSQPEPTEDQTIDPSSSKDDIISLQQLLKEQGWLSGNADGIYGNATKAAVSAFQNYVNLSSGYDKLNVSGIADGDTLDELLGGMYINPASSAPSPTATNEPIVFTDVSGSMYARALSDGTAVYTEPDLNKIGGSVNVQGEFMLIAEGGEWLKIQNPANGYIGYVLRNEFAIYAKEAPTSEPTATPAPEITASPEPTASQEATSTPTATPTNEPTATPYVVVTPQPAQESFITLDPQTQYVELTFDSEYLLSTYKSEEAALVRILYSGDKLKVLAYSENWFYLSYTDPFTGETVTGYALRDGFTETAEPVYEDISSNVTPTPTSTDEPTPTPTAEPTATPTTEPTATPTAEPTATPTAEPTATPTAEPTATPTAEPTATPTTEPTATPTMEPTATPTIEPTPTPSFVYDEKWTEKESEIKKLQDMLIAMGWLDKATLDIYGEYGSLGELTYEAIDAVQKQANDSAMTSVRDASGFLRQNNGTGDFYPIDEATYVYIMTKLPRK